MIVRSVWDDGGFSLRHYQAALAEMRHMGVLLRSMAIAAATAMAALLLGGTQALLLARANIAARGIWRYLFFLPLCIPPHVHAIAWIYFCGDTGGFNTLLMKLSGTESPVIDINTPVWTTVVLTLCYYPLVTLITYSGLQSMDHRLEEAARQYHTGARVLFKVTLPLVLPHIFTGAVFVFIFAFFNYGVPALLRVHTYPVEIFAQFSAFYNEAGATALSVPIILIAMLLLTLQRLWMRRRRYGVVDTGQTRAGQMTLKKTRRPANAFMALLFGASVVLPLAVLCLEIKGVAVFGALWRSAGRELAFTTGLSLIAATVITVMAYFLGGSVFTRRHEIHPWLDYLFFMPFAIPATMLGIGLIYTWNHPFFQWIYGSAAILVVAYAARFVPFSLQTVIAGMRQIGPGMRDAAVLYQGSWWRRAMAVELPLCLPAVVMAWAMAFILCMSELGVTLLVIPPGLGTLALKIYNLMHYGANQMVAALSMVLCAVNLTVAAAAVFCFRGRGRGTLGHARPGC